MYKYPFYIKVGVNLRTVGYLSPREGCSDGKEYSVMRCRVVRGKTLCPCRHSGVGTSF